MGFQMQINFVQFYVSPGRFWQTVVFICEQAPENSNASSREDYRYSTNIGLSVIRKQ